MPKENISKAEQILSLSIGARLLFFGTENLKRKPLPSVLKILLGSFLMYRGYSGHCPANEMLDISTAGQTFDEAIDTYTKPVERAETLNTIETFPQP